MNLWNESFPFKSGGINKYQFVLDFFCSFFLYFIDSLERSISRLVSRPERLRALATDAAGKLNVLGHDGDTLGVDGAQVGVLEEANKVGLGGFL